MKAKIEVDDEVHELESLPVRYGGNGAVGIFLTATLKVPVKDFVLKTNARRSLELTSNDLQQFLEHRRQTIRLHCGRLLRSATRDKLQRTLALTSFSRNTYVTCYVDEKLCLIESIDGKKAGDNLEVVREWLKTARMVTVLHQVPEYRRLRTALETQVKRLPLLVISARWTVDITLKLHVVGPIQPLPSGLVEVKRKDRIYTMVEANGPGILPNKLHRTECGLSEFWLQMPRGKCFQETSSAPQLSLAEIAAICSRLAIANLTLLRMMPPRFYGDNKPSNLCTWKDEGIEQPYLIDVDEVPTLEELAEGGGPRCFATFQLSHPDFDTNPVLMVLYSFLATVAAMSSTRNMEWLYNHSCHMHDRQPASGHEMLDSVTCSPKIDVMLRRGADLIDRTPDLEDLISYLNDAQQLTISSPEPKRRRLSMDCGCD